VEEHDHAAPLPTLGIERGARKQVSAHVSIYINAIPPSGEQGLPEIREEESNRSCYPLRECPIYK
jgi:hypothetical protein